LSNRDGEAWDLQCIGLLLASFPGFPTTASKKLGGGIMHVCSYNLKLTYCRMVVPQREDAEQLETTVSVVLLPQASIVYIYIYILSHLYMDGTKTSTKIFVAR